MSSIYHTYSDISTIGGDLMPHSGKHGYAYIVTLNKEIVVEGSGILMCKTNNAAEMKAMLLALNHIPDGVSVVVHSDWINIRGHIAKIFKKDHRYSKRTIVFKEVDEAFKNVLQRVACCFQYEPRKCRSWYHTCCHRASRLAREQSYVQPSECKYKGERIPLCKESVGKPSALFYASELLLKDHPLHQNFLEWCGSKSPTKKQARKFIVQNSIDLDTNFLNFPQNTIPSEDKVFLKFSSGTSE